MSKTLPWMIMTGMATVLLSISFCQPHLLSDSNSFLHNFVNHELLATLGFIVAVTLASSGGLHLELNKLEDETGNEFVRTRKSVRRSAYSLIALFAAAGVLVIVKPLLPSFPVNAAVANSIAILIVFFNLSVLYDLTRTTFAIPTVKKIKALAGAENPPSK